MSEDKMMPGIRFPNFKDKWDKQKIEDFLEINYGKDYKTLKTGNIPVYGTGGVITYVDTPISRKDGIGIGRKGTINNPVFLKAPFWTVDTLFYLLPKNNHNIYFLLQIIKNVNWLKYNEASGVPSLSAKNINSINLFVPELAEQQKIGHLFEKLDQAISLQRQVLETTKEYKQSMLQKMFPKKGEKVPEIRFKGFNEEWKQIYLEKATDITTGKLDANAMVVNGKYDFYTSGIQKYKINDYAFEGPAITIAGNGATVGYMHIADGLFNAYQRTYVLNNFKANRSYLFYEIKNRLPQKIHEESRAGNIPYIVMDMLTKLVINIPSKEEQQKIGSFFKTLDEKIEQEEKKLEAYESMKKALMQRMFV